MNVCMTNSDYEVLREYLAKTHPHIEVSLISEDINLIRLGFAEYIPCVVHMNLDKNGYDELMDDLMQLEVDAYNTQDGKNPLDTDPYYKEYIKYGWLWDVLNKAKEVQL